MSTTWYAPCLRGVMGDWVYYSTLMNAQQIKARILKAKDIREAKGLDDYLQRDLKEGPTASVERFLKPRPPTDEEQQVLESLKQGVIVEQLVIGLGKVIGFLSAVYQDFVGVADVVTGFFAKILGW